MASSASRVSPKGQVTIPVAIRKRFGIDPQDTVIFTVSNDVITLQPASAALRRFRASIPALDPPRDWKEVERIAHEEAALKAASEGLYPDEDSE